MSKEKSPIFKIIDSINFDKDFDMISDFNDSDYVPFMINKAMSMGIDTHLSAQEMNIHPFLDKTLQYKYYLYVVRKKKRFVPWAKKLQTSDKAKIIAEYYDISLRKAKEYESLISSQDLHDMRIYLDKGGIVKSKSDPKRNSDE